MEKILGLILFNGESHRIANHILQKEKLSPEKSMFSVVEHKFNTDEHKFSDVEHKFSTAEHSFLRR